MVRVWCCLVATVLIGISGKSPLLGEDLELGRLQSQIFAVVEKTAPAIVEVTSRGAMFSGAVISPEGHVLTAGHTIDPGQNCWVLFPDGQRMRARALGSCEQNRGDQLDCGLIKIDGVRDLPYIEVGSSANLQRFQPCLSISYPGGQRSRREPTVRFGHITTPARVGRLIRSTALMEPGDSGGPLLDLEGRLIGIHSRISQAPTENFDVPVDAFKLFWDQLNVPIRFSTRNLKPLPKLGFYGEDDPETGGILVLEVAEGGVARKVGLKADDVIESVKQQPVSSLSELQRALSDALEKQREDMVLVVRRSGQSVEFRFSYKDLVAPAASRPASMQVSPLDSESSSAEMASTIASTTTTQLRSLVPVTSSLPAYPELASLPKIVATLESQLDDFCCLIHSNLAGQAHQQLGTLIAGSSWVVSKNSMVGLQPFIIIGGKRLELELVARDEANDLVLLRSPEPNIAGVVLEPASKRLERFGHRGQLLLTPDPEGQGVTSVMSSSVFSSRREVSRGWLGVELEDFQSGGVILRTVNEGAARNAGLKTGDVILQVNQRTIRNRPDIQDFLRSFDPNTKIQAKVRRETTEFETEITLGAPPSNQSHAADLMEKSARRDGFTNVFAHDATLQPSECGGPLFDLDGNFVGINIARHSRTRTFAAPASLIYSLIDQQVAP